MAKPVDQTPSNKPLAGQEKSGPKERRVPFETLEAWLVVATDGKTDPYERLGWLQSAIAWTLGKDSKLATHIMTRSYVGASKTDE